MMRKKMQLLVLSVAVAVATFAVTMVATRAQVTRQEFDEITVHRIRVVEPDGTLRIVISNYDGLPTDARGTQQGQNGRPGAGLLFYNNEGIENGGLIFGGHRDAAGRVVDAGVSLSFDKYGVGGRMVQLAGVSDSENRFAGLRVRDTTVGRPNTNRVWVGNTEDGAATVALMDQQGRRRIVMEVKADGSSSLTFLDENGKAVNQLAPRTVQP